jgi:Glycosyltransferase family 87
MTFYAAGRMVRQGLRHGLYNVGAELNEEQHLFGRTFPQNVYDHPPFETALYVPFSYLPYTAAHLLWDLLSLLLLAWSLYLLRPYAPNLTTESRLVLTLAILYPLISILREGQNEILLLAACTGGFIALKKNREFAAGCAFAAGLFRFPFTLPLLVIFLALRRCRLILGAAAASAALGVFSLVFVGWDGIRQYLAMLVDLSKAGAFPAIVPAMPNLRGFLNLSLSGRIAAPWLTALTVCGSIALLAWPIWKWSRAGWAPASPAFNLNFSLSAIICLLVSYHSLIHGLLLLALPGLLLLDYFARPDVSGFARWKAALPLAASFVMPLAVNAEMNHELSLLFVPVLWLAVVASAAAAESGALVPLASSGPEPLPDAERGRRAQASQLG